MKRHPGRQRRLDESKVEMRKAEAVKVLSEHDRTETVEDIFGGAFDLVSTGNKPRGIEFVDTTLAVSWFGKEDP